MGNQLSQTVLIKSPDTLTSLWSQEYFQSLGSGLLLSNNLPAKLTDLINQNHADQYVKNKALKKETNTLPSGTAKKDYS